MNVPNFLTITRILLIPLLVIFLLEGEMRYAFWVFVAAGVTDGLDGFLARLLKQKTDFGAFIDPIADKLLLITSYITLAVLETIPKWLTVVVVSRDILIVGGIGVLMSYNRPFDIKPSFDSKITTFMQLATIAFFLGRDYLPPTGNLDIILIALTTFFTILSGTRYIIIGFRILGNPDTVKRSGDDG